jgi:hypothetical protein
MSVRRRCVDLLQYFNPFSANLASPPQDEALPAAKKPRPFQPPQDEDIPAAKRQRLEASTSTSTAEDTADADTYFYAPTIDAVTTAPYDVTGTVFVAPTGAVCVLDPTIDQTNAHGGTRWNSGAPQPPPNLIIDPQPSDVMLGRGRKYLRNPGNIRLLSVLNMHIVQYENASNRTEKTETTHEIVKIMQTWAGRCRFLKYDSDAGGYYEVADEVARVKVGTALRYALKVRRETKRIQLTCAQISEQQYLAPTSWHNAD